MRCLCPCGISHITLMPKSYFLSFNIFQQNSLSLSIFTWGGFFLRIKLQNLLSKSSQISKNNSAKV